MASLLDNIDEAQAKGLLLRVLAWRVGDMPDLPKTVSDTYSIPLADALVVLEKLCPAIDFVIQHKPESDDAVISGLRLSDSDETGKKIARAAFLVKDKGFAFCLEHTPSLSRVLYHDWHLETQVATETLGRIARPVASITLRVQPAAKGNMILPPLESVSMELVKDMVDALSSGFDRLQMQLTRIVQ